MPKFRFGIATVLTLAFGGLALLSTGILLFFAFGSTLEATRSVLSTRLEGVINEAEQVSMNFFEPIEEQASWLSREIVEGGLDPENAFLFSQTAKGVLASLPQVTAISYQKPDGTGSYYEAAEGKLHTVTWPQNWRVALNQSETNPQTRPPSGGVWVLRPSVLSGTPQSTFLYPVRTAEGDLGVIAFRVNVATLSDRVAEDATLGQFNLVRFILFNDRIVVAHPELKGMRDIQRPSIDDIKDPYLKKLSDSERINLALINDLDDIETFGIEHEDETRVFAVKEDSNRRSGGSVLIGVHFSAETASVEIRRLFSIGIIGLGLLFASMLGAYLLGRWAAKPIQELSEAAQLVQANKLDEVKPLPKNPVVELSSALGAFNGMVDGLRERERIRDLFGKYVPQDVADLLVEDDQIAKPTDATATVLFLDLVGFSSISEKLTPAELVDTMNSFFSEAVAIIEKEEGIVTQFQGDAILAVFNVPVERKDHANAAIRTAKAIADILDAQIFGGQKLDCRIGINTGPLVAGAIGAKDRLSYTVYGDAVNVAARLEFMNKEYGTRILIAEETVEQAEGFNFKEVGTLPVRGRKKDVKTYTLS